MKTKKKKKKKIKCYECQKIIKSTGLCKTCRTVCLHCKKKIKKSGICNQCKKIPRCEKCTIIMCNKIEHTGTTSKKPKICENCYNEIKNNEIITWTKKKKKNYHIQQWSLIES